MVSEISKWLLVCVVGISINAHAEDTSAASKAKLEDVKPSNKVDGNIDEEITNERMRADSGSKSKFSLSVGVGYTGASIQKPLAEERPNLSGAPGNQKETSANVGVSGRYRWDKNNSAYLGSSFGVMTPFQGHTDSTSKQMNLFDPTIGYNHVGKLGIFQTTSTVGTSYGTSQASLDTKYISGIGLGYNALYAFQNGLTVGSSVSYGWNYYSNKPGEQTAQNTSAPGYYGGDKRIDWSVGIFPYMEYKFNDTLSARTVFGYFNWKHLYGDNEKPFRLLQTYVYQSVGVGISVTRDIYLYPNVQFVPDNIRDDFTNVALSATINIF